MAHEAGSMSPTAAHKMRAHGTPGGAKGRTMGNVEYKAVRIQWKDEVESRLDQLVDAVNVYAKDGWRVASVDLTAHGSFAIKTLPVLLERDAKTQ
jgi:hypothetical protein